MYMYITCNPYLTVVLHPEKRIRKIPFPLLMFLSVSRNSSSDCFVASRKHSMVIIYLGGQTSFTLRPSKIRGVPLASSSTCVCSFSASVQLLSLAVLQQHCAPTSAPLIHVPH